MSGDGTYIEYVSTGEGPAAEIPHPPKTDNPHDPLHYYQGTDGRYYYSPDGSPQEQFGQPPVKDAGTPDDLKNEVKRTEEPNPNWKHEASKGYKMVPDDLRGLASKLESDLNTLKPLLDRVQSEGKVTQAAVGNWQSGADFVHVSDTAYGAFTQYYSDIVTTYKAVIQRLRTTANNGQQGEDKTHQAVTSQQTGNSDAGTPKTMS
jgi:hypothetical protein